MVEQVVSMALTLAHHSDRESFGWEDMTEAMTTLESGTAVDIEYVPQETRATAIHEAGHAVAGHVYMQGSESTRLSIRMRGGSLGHHQARDKEERFSSWRSEEFAKLVWTLGAMAAEEIFYGENTSGVGGDVQSVTARAAFMVGASAMGPMPVELSKFADESEEETRARVMHQFEQIGLQIMNRTSGGGPLAADPISSVLSDRDKRRTAARLLGQAYIAAYNLVAANKDAVDRVANELIEKREIFGNELVGLLDSLELEAPDIDYTKDEAWPRI
jgi:ATP-dependent Zn protease